MMDEAGCVITGTTIRRIFLCGDLAWARPEVRQSDWSHE
jgi:hypothetical protein